MARIKRGEDGAVNSAGSKFDVLARKRAVIPDKPRSGADPGSIIGR